MLTSAQAGMWQAEVPAGGPLVGMEAYVIIGIAILALLLVGAALWWARSRKKLPEKAPGEAPPKVGREAPPGRPAPTAEARDRAAGALQTGLEKTRGGFIARIAGLLGRKR